MAGIRIRVWLLPALLCSLGFTHILTYINLHGSLSSRIPPEEQQLIAPNTTTGTDSSNLPRNSLNLLRRRKGGIAFRRRHGIKSAVWNSTNSTRCIVALTSREKIDLLSLCQALMSLKFLNFKADDPPSVFIFHEKVLQRFQNKFLMHCAAPLPLKLANDGFGSFPDGFHPLREHNRFRKRSKWGYQQMCRFWITTLWENPLIQHCDTIMRVDSDSCYTGPIDDLPGLSSERHVYRSYYIDANKDPVPVVKGLMPFIRKYVDNHTISPKWPQLWDQTLQTWDRETLLPTFETHFEIARLKFMKEMEQVHRALTEHEPFGVLRKRWGDAPVRVLIMALFATPDQVKLEKPDTYVHHRMNFTQSSLCQASLGLKNETLHELYEQFIDNYRPVRKNQTTTST